MFYMAYYIIFKDLELYLFNKDFVNAFFNITVNIGIISYLLVTYMLIKKLTVQNVLESQGS